MLDIADGNQRNTQSQHPQGGHDQRTVIVYRNGGSAGINDTEQDQRKRDIEIKNRRKIQFVRILFLNERRAEAAGHKNVGKSDKHQKKGHQTVIFRNQQTGENERNDKRHCLGTEPFSKLPEQTRHQIFTI